MKSPSKYLSLEYLNALRENYYCNLDKGIDYAPGEVDILIYIKQAERSEKDISKMYRDYEEYKKSTQRESGKKHCTKCEVEKVINEFHIDSSKKFFGRRSHCKECRTIRKCPF